MSMLIWSLCLFGQMKRTVQKQSSMNEELMSTERLQENERVRRNIYKQASLNEEIMCKRMMNFESLYSGLKSGLTSRITNIEKVSTLSIKNGFVRIFQSWKSDEMIEDENFKTVSMVCEYLYS